MLVYSTCTVLREENENVVDAFLSATPDFRLAAIETLPESLAPLLDERGFLHCFPHLHDTDGFFAARLARLS